MDAPKEKKTVPVNQFSAAEIFQEIGLRVADYIDVMLAYWDKKSVCRFANIAYLQWFGKRKEAVVNILQKKELLGDLFPQHEPGLVKVLQGEKQIFENVRSLPSGESSFYITTYYPDVANGEVIGYFEHVIDITSLKQMELKLLQMEQAKKREMLRSVIETQEAEREAVAYELKDKVNQTLAYCKMMLEKESSQEPSLSYLKNFSQYIHQAIDELNALGNKMLPSSITMLGFVAGVKEYINAFQQKREVAISFYCKSEAIEQMRGKDKIAIFRIIQDFLIMLVNNPQSDNISLIVEYFHPSVILQLSHNDPAFELPTKSKEYRDIIHRIEYFGGAINESLVRKQKVLKIELMDIY